MSSADKADSSTTQVLACHLPSQRGGCIMYKLQISMKTNSLTVSGTCIPVSQYMRVKYEQSAALDKFRPSYIIHRYIHICVCVCMYLCMCVYNICWSYVYIYIYIYIYIQTHTHRCMSFFDVIDLHHNDCQAMEEDDKRLTQAYGTTMKAIQTHTCMCICTCTFPH